MRGTRRGECEKDSFYTLWKGRLVKRSPEGR